MSLLIGSSSLLVKPAGAAGVADGIAAAEGEEEKAASVLSPGGAGTASAARAGGSGQGQVVDTLLDRLSDLHERLQRLRRELRSAVNSPQPDVVRMPRILSLQRQLLVTNSDIQLVSGLLISTLSKSVGSVNTQV